MDSLRTKLAQTAFHSRLFVLGLSVVSNLVIPDHDAGVFRWTVSPSTANGNATGYVDGFIALFTDGLTRWDGQYFLHIANNGYTFENTLAFFPLYPMVTRAVADVLYWLQVDYGIVHFSSTLKMAGIMVNVGCFVAATLALFELSRKVLRDDYLAYRAALFFCWNPASIFFTATYSESLYAMLTFGALLKLEHGFTIKMGLLLAAASACRANALVNLGFVAYKGTKLLIRELVIHRRLSELERSEMSETVANIVGDAVMPTVMCTMMGVAPFAFYQWYAFTKFCGLTKPRNDFGDEIITYAMDNDLKLPSADAPPWCYEKIPIPYSYIQSHYWQVGFLQYFQLKQIPNFLLAAPVLYIIGSQAVKYFKYHEFYSLRLGFTYFNLDPAQRVPAFDLYTSRVLPREAFVYVVHAAALAVFCFFFVHVQVSTRLILSSSPVFYWLAALMSTAPDRKRPSPRLLNLDKEENVLKLETKRNLNDPWRSMLTEEPIRTKEAKYLKLYHVLYIVVGTVLFSNFLPWT